MSIRVRPSISYVVVLSGALAALLSSAVAAQAKGPLPFQPGPYAGYTNQRCPAEPVPAGICQPGKRLKISFTVSKRSKHAIQRLSVPIVEKCLQPRGVVVHVMSLPPKRQGPVKTLPGTNEVALKANLALFFTTQSFAEGDENFGQDTLTGTLRKASASGHLSSAVPVNSSGQLDGKSGNLCFTHSVHWHAKHAGAKQSAHRQDRKRRLRRGHRPAVSWSLPSTANASQPIGFSWSGRHLGHGRLVIQKPEGTAHTWRTIMRLPSKRGSASLPGLALGKYRFRIADLAGRRVLSQQVAGVAVFGEVPFSTLIGTGDAGVHATPTANFSYVEQFDDPQRGSALFNVERNNCRFAHVAFVAWGWTDKGETGLVTLTLVQESHDPTSASVPIETIGGLDTELTPGQSWAVNASYDAQEATIYINGYALCDSTEPFFS